MSETWNGAMYRRYVELDNRTLSAICHENHPMNTESDRKRAVTDRAEDAQYEAIAAPGSAVWALHTK